MDRDDVPLGRWTVRVFPNLQDMILSTWPSSVGTLDLASAWDNTASVGTSLTGLGMRPLFQHLHQDLHVLMFVCSEMSRHRNRANVLLNLFLAFHHYIMAPACECIAITLLTTSNGFQVTRTVRDFYFGFAIHLLNSSRNGAHGINTFRVCIQRCWFRFHLWLVYSGAGDHLAHCACHGHTRHELHSVLRLHQFQHDSLLLLLTVSMTR